MLLLNKSVRYPEELAWQLDLHRKLIRQNDSLKGLHQLLIQETESVSFPALFSTIGNLSVSSLGRYIFQREFDNSMFCLSVNQAF